MKNLLKIEELLLFVLGIYLFNSLDYSWWWFIALFLAPDLSMLGYLINTKVGALCYNIFHHKGLAIIIYLLGVYFQNEIMSLVGVILFSHASFDRVFGYGLKYPDKFEHTHLGKIGK